MARLRYEPGGNQVPVHAASIEVHQIRPKHRVHRLRVREVVRLEHVDQEMNRCSIRLILREHPVEREPITVEDRLDVGRPPSLEIVDYENIPIVGQKEAPAWKPDILGVSIRNQLAAPDHPQLAP